MNKYDERNSLRRMIGSFMAYGSYGWTAKAILQSKDGKRYLGKYVDKYSENYVRMQIDDISDKINIVNKDVFSDHEGVSYNAIDWKLSYKDYAEKDGAMEGNEGIKEYYQRTFPSDTLADDMNDNKTLADLWVAIVDGIDVYEVIGVGDSLIRERLFERLAELFSTNYNDIYGKWRTSLSA